MDEGTLMKTFMAHLDPGEGLRSVLDTALLCARMFDGYLEGVHLRNAEPELVAAGADGFIAAAPELMAGLEQEAQTRAQQAREAFEVFITEQGLSRLIDKGTGKGLCADWRMVRSQGTGAIGHWGRIFDLIVVASACESQPSHHTAILETALFESGRPVMIAPPGSPEKLGEVIVIAWNCSTETARTVALAMPFIKRAREVIVLTVDPGTVPGPPGDAMAAQLKHHGIDARAVHSKAGDMRPGAKILAESARLGADLLVKGAFTQSRLRQMIFGGATSHIIAHADLPVIMAN
jgi:nucleotide-binding universal stress UspA family protein